MANKMELISSSMLLQHGFQMGMYKFLQYYWNNHVILLLRYCLNVI